LCAIKLDRLKNKKVNKINYKKKSIHDKKRSYKGCHPLKRYIKPVTFGALK